jgi:hypothetical protein
MLGWLLGIGCVIHAILRRSIGYFPRVHPGISEHPWLDFFSSPRNELWFGVLLVTGVSWIKKTRDEASDDMDEANGVNTDNTRPEPEVGHPITLQNAKRLRRGGSDYVSQDQPRNVDSGDASEAAFRWYFGRRLFGLLVFVSALLAYFITSSPSTPSFVVLLVSPGSALGPQALPLYGQSVVFPSATTVGINAFYYGAIFWFLLFRRKG